MSDKSSKSAKVGDLIEVPELATVVRPEGYSSQVTGGGYFLDVPGVFVVDGSEVSAK